MILVDTNILIHSVYPSDPRYELTSQTLNKLTGRNETLCIAPQNVVEFWAVATRPQLRNGLGLTLSAANQEVETLHRLFQVLPYSAQVLHTWQRIVMAQNVSGKQAHDAHLAAMMQVHSVMSILTFNGQDFARYPGIQVLDPAQV